MRPATYRGLLVQAPQITPGNELPLGTDPADLVSLYTQAAGVNPAPAQPDRVSGLAVYARGDVPTGEVRLETIRGGYAEPQGASFAWQTASGARQGWMPPTVLTGYELVESATRRYPHAVTLADQTVVVVVDVSAGSQVGAYLRGVDGTWTNSTVTTKDGPGYHRPCLTRLPAREGEAERLLCWYLVWADEAMTTAQIEGAISTDGGGTWEEYALAVLPEGLTGVDWTYSRLRCSYARGQLLLVVEVRKTAPVLGDYESILFQYASDDVGNSFTLVAEWTGEADSAGAFVDLLVVNDQWHLFYVDPYTDSPRHCISTRVVSSAFTDFLSAPSQRVEPTGAADYGATSGVAPNQYISDGDCAAVQDADGTIYVLARRLDTDYQCVVWASHDLGLTWETMDVDNVTSGTWWRSEDAQTTPAHFSAVAQEGRLLLLTNVYASPGTSDLGLHCFALGGYSSITLPRAQYYPEKHRYTTHWNKTWVPIELPHNTPTDTLVTGTGTANLTSGALEVATTTAGAQQHYWECTTYSNARGLLALVDVDVTAGPAGPPTDTSIGARFVIDDGTDRYEVELCCGLDGITVRDPNDKPALIATQPLSYPIQILIGVRPGTGSDNGRVRVAWREHGALDSEMAWTELCDWGTLDRAASGGAGDLMEWGHITAPAVDCESRWTLRLIADEDMDVLNWLTDVCDWDELYGRTWSPTGVPIPGSMAVYGVAGPARMGDSWTILEDRTYGTRFLYPDKPFNRSWRSAVDGVDTYIGWDLSGGVAADSHWLEDSLAVMVAGVNIRYLTLQGYEQGTGWVDLLEADLASEGYPFQRRGQTLRPSSAAALTGRVWRHGEFVGQTADIGGTLRRITRQTGGTWVGHTVATAHQPTLYCEDITGTEAATGTLRVWPRAALLCVSLVADAAGDRYRAFRLKIPAHTTLDGYYEIHTAIVGTLHAWGATYSSDRVQKLQQQGETVKTRDGELITRQEGPKRRAVEIQWSDPVDGLDDTPLEISDTTPRAVASVAETPSLVMGLVSELGLAQSILGYVARVPTDSDAVVITDSELFFPVRLLSMGPWETVMGDEGEDELQTGGQLELREER